MTVTWTKYRPKTIREMRPYDYVAQESMEGISVNPEDRKAGSPKAGDMIARNPLDHKDQWLVSAKYFSENFDPVP